MKAFRALAITLLPLILTPVLSELLIETQQGPVLGTNLAEGQVRRWLGIPYATANRWEPPQAPPHRTNVFPANEFGDSCCQALTPLTLDFLDIVGNSGVNVTESEDCLSLNAWAPGIARKQGTAVLLWIHGGGLTSGTSKDELYDGLTLVKDHDDITLVTINYRLNIFSSPSAPQLLSSAGPQNFALLDIDAAIDWVYANIAGFGGDPERITLFGQSAGSVAVDAYSFAHPHSKKVKGLIQQSGTISAGPAAAGLPSESITAWKTVSEAVGCGTDETPEQLACMKNVPGRTLEDAVISTNIAFNALADNVTLFADSIKRAAAGHFLKVPVLMGTNGEENDSILLPLMVSQFEGVIPGVLNIQSDTNTLIVFTCPAGEAARYRLNANVPTWRYLYQGVFPGISSQHYLRSFHNAEIPMIFGTYINPSNSHIPPTKAQISLSSLMQKAWVTFARDPANGLAQSVGWPVYDHAGRTLVLLGNKAEESGATFTNGTLVDKSCTRQDVLGEIAQRVALLLSPPDV